MRVSGKTGAVGSTQGVSGSRPASAPATSPATPVASTDAVQVSAAARLVAVAQEALAGVPDIRTEIVESIKGQMDSDSYHPDGKAVADGLIREHLARVHQP